MKAIINANVFDGKNKKLKENATIIIDKNIIKEITNDNISLENFEEVIDAGNRTVIPGLIDNHVHIATASNIRGEARVDEEVVHGVRTARDILLRGFTTVRDAGGVIYGIKKGIDEGIIDGPRIFPSNAYISQTCGHGDLRSSRADYRVTDGLYTSAKIMGGRTYIADGVSEMLRAVREQLFLGASQIKIMAGGGVASIYDPIGTIQFTYEEMKAAVDAAADYGTYVMAHLYTNESMQRAARAGVKSFEHGQLLDEETAKIIQDKGIFINPCPNFKSEEEEKTSFDDPIRRQKGLLIRKGVEKQTELINKYELKLLFGTDYVEGLTCGIKQSQDLSSYKEKFGSYKGLVSATGNANEIIKLTTYQNPYPEGKIGVLEEGAFADLLIVEGNPVEDLDILADPDRNIKLIMKNAGIYKNTL